MPDEKLLVVNDVLPLGKPNPIRFRLLFDPLTPTFAWGKIDAPAMTASSPRANESFLLKEEKYFQNASTAAQTVAKTSWDRYQSGVQGIFDTLESQRRAFDAESRLLSTRRERISNRINLFLALGIPALPIEP